MYSSGLKPSLLRKSSKISSVSDARNLLCSCLEGARNLILASGAPQSTAGSAGKLEAAWVCSRAALASAASLMKSKKIRK